MKYLTTITAALIFALLSACVPQTPSAPTASAPTATAVVLPTQPAQTQPATAQPAPTAAVPTAAGSPAGTPGGSSGEQLDQALAQSVESKNFEAMRALMPARFSFAAWNTSLVEVTAEEAIQRLRDTYLPAGSAPKVKFDTDIPALLGGNDPLSYWGPVAKPIRALYVTGLGPQAKGEAVLVIGQSANGSPYWHGILLPAGDTFSQGQGQVEGPQPTDVKYLEALEAVNLRSGPGMNYASEGLMRQGEIAMVNGISTDGAWYQVVCTTDSSGFCWVTADPTLTKPTTAP